MRVKIIAKQYGIEKLEFGKRYFIAYAGCSYGEDFLFTRKNMIEMCDRDGNTGKKISSYRISKRKLKELLRLGILHFMCETD